MSWYVVKRGRIPGIYTDWDSCEKQIKGFSNAKFKKFNVESEARSYFEKDSSITVERPTEGMAVDAAFSMKKDIGEYQIYDLVKKEIVYRSREYKNVTVNIMEFLAICKSLELFPYEDIYSDSATAITWVEKQKINSNKPLDSEVQKEIDLALFTLKSNILGNKIIKWDTHIFGDIPADFGRK